MSRLLGRPIQNVSDWKTQSSVSLFGRLIIEVVTVFQTSFNTTTTRINTMTLKALSFDESTRCLTPVPSEGPERLSTDRTETLQTKIKNTSAAVVQYKKTEMLKSLYRKTSSVIKMENSQRKQMVKFLT